MQQQRQQLDRSLYGCYVKGLEQRVFEFSENRRAHLELGVFSIRVILSSLRLF